jgi:predicted  nucleic acid-binding Zn-ribbon protein
VRLTLLALTVTTALTTFCPISASAQQGDISSLQSRLVEVETKAMTLQAERDEYRSLLHRERQRLKDISGMQDNIAANDSRANNMVETIRKLESEKIDLMRQLDFAKRGPKEAQTLASQDSSKMAEMQQRLNEIQDERQQLARNVRTLETDKQRLMGQLSRAQVDLEKVQKQKIKTADSSEITAMRDKQVEALQQEISILKNQNNNVTDDALVKKLSDIRTLEAEVASLEAQNKMLREDIRSVQAAKSGGSTELNQKLASLESQYSNRFRVMEGENIRLTRELENEKNKKPDVIERIVEVEKIVEIVKPETIASRPIVEDPQTPSFRTTQITQANVKSVPLSSRQPIVQKKIMQDIPNTRTISMNQEEIPPIPMVAENMSDVQIQPVMDHNIENAQITVMADSDFRSVPVQNADSVRVSPNIVRRSLRSKIVKQDVVLPTQTASIMQFQPVAQIVPSPSTPTVINQNVNSTPSYTSMPLANNVVSSAPMVELSGDKIKRLVMNSNVPLISGVERVNKVSGPDFAAFRWDTGNVYGSAEQTKLASPQAFSQSVQSYINKVQSRCDGSFDQTNASVIVSSGITARAVDIACVSNTQGAATVSVLFFEENGMFYAIAHEADLNTFETAMDLRDRIASNLIN